MMKMIVAELQEFLDARYRPGNCGTQSPSGRIWRQEE